MRSLSTSIATQFRYFYQRSTFLPKPFRRFGFQDISDLEMEDNILYVYEQMLRKYESDKAMIPAGNLIELKYEDFEHEPLVNLEHIYQQLNLPNFNITKDRFVKYIDSQKKFKVNKHQISDEKIEKSIVI